MRRLFKGNTKRRVAVLLWMWAAAAYAQFDLLTYDFDGHPASVFSQPASLAAGRFGWVTPLLPHVQAQIKLSGPTAYDLFAADGKDFNRKWQDALQNLNARQGVLAEVKNIWLAAHWRRENNMFRLGFYSRFRTWAFHPVSFYRMALYGNKEHPETELKFNELNFNVDLVHVLYGGWARQWDNGLSAGINVKIYNSAGNISSYGNRGKLYYTDGQNNYYTEVLEDVALNVHSSGLGRLVWEDKAGQYDVNKDKVRADIISRLTGTGNWGLGLDAGLRFPVGPQWTASVSVEDLGVIRYADDNFSVRARGSYRFQGVHVVFPENPVDYWGQIRDDFKKKLPVDSLRTVYYKMEPFKVYAGLRYTFPGRQPDDYACYRPWKNVYDRQKAHSYAGAVLFYQNLQGRPYLGAGAYWHWVAARWLQLRLSWSADNYIGNNLGLAVQWRIWRWHWYAMADNLLGYANLAASHGQFVALGTYWLF